MTKKHKTKKSQDTAKRKDKDKKYREKMRFAGFTFMCRWVSLAHIGIVDNFIKHLNDIAKKSNQNMRDSTQHAMNLSNPLVFDRKKSDRP